MQENRPRYVIDRPAYNLPDFDREFDKKSQQFPVASKVKKHFSCSAKKLKGFLFRHLPVLRWLPKYRVRESLLTDVIAGVSGGTIQVPQGMAFALIANLPPVNGLYSSFFPLIPYFFMGTTPQAVPGTFAIFSMMVGMVCINLAPESDFSHFNATLNATVVDTDTLYEARLRISATLACLTAIIQVGLSFMQFGFVAIYLSESFIRGFMTAAALKVLISVLKNIFDISIRHYSGPLAIVYTLIDTCRNLPSTNVASFVFGLISLIVLIVVKELSTRYRQKLPFPIPVEIVVVVVSTAISGLLHFPEKHNISIVGQVALGFPSPVLPTVSLWQDLLSVAFSLAIIGYIIHLALARTLAAKHAFDMDANQEMLALGSSNFLGSFFKSQVITSSLTVTMAVDTAGGSSQFSSLTVMAVVLVTLLALGVYLGPLPKSVLGALIAVNLRNALKQLSDPYHLWKKCRLDCCVWMVTFLATFLLGLPFGVAIGVGFSILVVMFRTQFRNGSALVQITDTDIYKNPKMYSKGREITGVKILNCCSPLYFANAEIFRQRVIKKTGLDPSKVITARRKVLEKEQKEKEKREKKEKKERKKNPGLSVGMAIKTISQLELQNDFDTKQDGGDNKPEDTIGSVRFGFSDAEQRKKLPHEELPFHTLILDLAGACFIDLTGIKVLIKMNSRYSMLGIRLYLANIQAKVYEELRAGGVFDEGNIASCNVFLSVHDACLFAQQNCEESPEAQKETEEVALYVNEAMDLEQEIFEP